MNRFLFTVLVSVLLLIPSASTAAGQPSQRILLSDNTVLIGKVIELKDGLYTIETDTLGIIKIDAGKIVEIAALKKTTSGSATEPVKQSSAQPDENRPAKEIKIIDGGKSAEGNSVSGSSDLGRQQEEVNSRVQSMTMNGDFLDSMMNLSESSSMSEVMQDPEIMDAISRNDYEFLMNSEKMKSLMDSQDIKNMLGDVQP